MNSQCKNKSHKGRSCCCFPAFVALLSFRKKQKADFSRPSWTRFNTGQLVALIMLSAKNLLNGFSRSINPSLAKSVARCQDY